MTITFKTGSFFGITGSSGTLAATIPTAISVGDFVFVTINYSSTLSQRFPSVTDNNNVGPWNVSTLVNYFSSGPNAQIVGAWIHCDTACAASTMVVTAYNVGTVATTAGVCYNGFVFGPSLVSIDITTASGTSTAVAANPLTNSIPNEITFAAATYTGGQNIITATGSFTDRKNGAGYWLGDSINASSSNLLTFGQTITSANWATMLVSFQDAITNSAPIAWSN